jgi:dihydromethanopterin reductase
MSRNPLSLIAQIGADGQIGLDGAIPWEGDERLSLQTNYAEDKFQQLTEGGILLMGKNTHRKILLAPCDPHIEVWDSKKYRDPMDMLVHLFTLYADKPVFVVGGKEVFRLFMPYVDNFYIFKNTYDGPADMFLPPLLQTWRQAIPDGRDDIVGQFAESNIVPRDFILITRSGIPVWFGHRREVNEDLFNLGGTIAYMHPISFGQMTKKLKAQAGRPN